MNIQDVDRIPTIVGDRLTMIWERQTSLHEKYKSIEVRNGVGYGLIFSRGFNIDDCRSQAYIKDLCWRVTEEIAEASEAFLAGEVEHGQEEIADGFHFLVELCIVLGLTPENIQKALPDTQAVDRLELLYSAPYVGGYPKTNILDFNRPEISFTAWSVVEQLGLACNCLKNKAWKQTQMETDSRRMNKHIKEAFQAFIRLAAYGGMGSNDLFETYFKKSEVNKFRIRSQY